MSLLIWLLVRLKPVRTTQLLPWAPRRLFSMCCIMETFWRPGWARVLASGRVRASMKTYLTSMEYDLGLDGRGAGTIAIVAAMIAEEEAAQGRPAKLTGSRKHSVPSQSVCAGGEKEEQHAGE